MLVDQGGGGRNVRSGLMQEKWSDVGYIWKIKSAGLSDKKNEGVEG